jgi:hypothetical protein
LARKRQIILLKATEAGKAGGGGGMEPLGSVREVVAALGPYNCAPDGSGPEGLGERLGLALLHGPGFVVEVPTGNDEVTQLMVTVTDEDFAWAVLVRMCRGLSLKMMDPDTGRTFG